MIRFWYINSKYFDKFHCYFSPVLPHASTFSPSCLHVFLFNILSRFSVGSMWMHVGPPNATCAAYKSVSNVKRLLARISWQSSDKGGIHKLFSYLCWNFGWHDLVNVIRIYVSLCVQWHYYLKTLSQQCFFISASYNHFITPVLELILLSLRGRWRDIDIPYKAEHSIITFSLYDS